MVAITTDSHIVTSCVVIDWLLQQGALVGQWSALWASKPAHNFARRICSAYLVLRMECIACIYSMQMQLALADRGVNSRAHCITPG